MVVRTQAPILSSLVNPAVADNAVISSFFVRQFFSLSGLEEEVNPAPRRFGGETNLLGFRILG